MQAPEDIPKCTGFRDMLVKVPCSKLLYLQEKILAPEKNVVQTWSVVLPSCFFSTVDESIPVVFTTNIP